MRKTVKTFIVVAICAMSLIACNRECISTLFSKNDEILFRSNGVKVEVKSFTEADNSQLQANGFKVAAVIDEDNSVMFNSAVAYNSGDAVYRVSGSNYFYPNEGTMSFYAAYPASETIALSEGAASITYAQNADEDLVVSKALAVAKQGTPIQMDFEHILAQVSINCTGEDTSADYKVKGIKITSADGGVYSFADDRWTLDTTDGEYNVYSNTAGITVTTKTPVGSAMSFIPDTVQLNVIWDCFSKGTENLISTNNQTVEITLSKGKHSTLNLILPSNASEIAFDTSVEEWENEEENIEVKEYVFTVDDRGSTIVFSPGNLYWDGTKYCFEQSQLDYCSSNTENHIGCFIYSRSETIARSSASSDSSARDCDIIFAANGGAMDGWTVLTAAQWDYIKRHSTMNNFVSINGALYAVLAPDDFDGEIMDTYTLSEWRTAERKGLVALPCTQGEYGFYWSQTSSSTSEATGIAVGGPGGEVASDNRYNTYSSIRLVKFVNHVKKDGIFTLNGGRKCKFAPGDLYWDGTRFRFEDSQLDRPSTNTATHIGLFYWNKDASIARDISLSYDDPILNNADEGDVLFAADGGAIAGWTVLSSDEISNILAYGTRYIEGAVINGKKYDLLIPDDFNLKIYFNFDGFDHNEGVGEPRFYGGEISSSEWEFLEAEYGIVALGYTDIYPHYHWFRDLANGAPNSEGYCISHSDGGEIGIFSTSTSEQHIIRLAKYVD